MPHVHVVTNLGSPLPRRRSATMRRPLKLSTLARREGLDPRRAPVVCSVNGRWVLQRRWRRVTARGDDVVVFAVMPRGKDIGRSIAFIALAVVVAFAAPYLGGLVAGAFGATGAIATGITAAVGVGLMVGGSMLINALLPAEKAGGALSSSGAAEFATYQFTASSQQNLSRLGAPIPVLYGRHRIVPDLAATPWWEWIDGVQYLHQALVLTQGYCEVERVEMGKSPISAFEDIETELVPPGGTITLFPGEAYQSPDVRGITLAAPNDLPVGDDGVYGPFAATPPGVTTIAIGIDIGFPRGSYDAASGSPAGITTTWRIEICEVDDAGAEIGAWTTLANETFNSVPGSVNTSAGGQFMAAAGPVPPNSHRR